MVGSHGIEFVPPYTAGSYLAASIVPPALLEGFTQITQSHPGTRLEEKAFGLALHTRGVEEGLGARAQQAARSLCEGWEGEIVVRRGHGILECSLIQATKGDGLQKLREVTGCQATLFAGDDVTDEDALVLMRGDDVGIRVGGGHSSAAFHVVGCEDIASVLWHVYELLQAQSDPAASLPM
jgi:trehalose 6-phosphate phosphatase